MSTDRPIDYIARTRRYYEGLGYGPAYVWAHYADVPFQPLKKPLADSRVALVTTAAPYQPDKGDQGPGAPYNAAAKFYKVYAAPTGFDPDLRISHLAIDRHHTTAEDQNSYFPLPALRRARAKGRVGALAREFFGLPTNRSQHTTVAVDCPDLLERVRSNGVDAVILVANCPVCHQSVSLAARCLEENGISTVIMGCARDIVEHVGVPRFVFSDFPLGNAAGRPGDRASQDLVMAIALEVLEEASTPRTTRQTPFTWSDTSAWKDDYCNIAKLTPQEIAARRAAFDRGKAVARQLRDVN